MEQRKKTKDFALIMLQDNEPVEKIVRYTKLTLDEINELAASLQRA